MNHPDDSVLQRFKSGRLSSGEIDELEKHLAECDACGQRIDDLDVQPDPLVRLLYEGMDETIVRPIPHQSVPFQSEPKGQHSPPPIRKGSAGAGRRADPTRIPHYQDHHLLGHGGMGVVYRAFDPRVRRQVALKVIAPQREWRPEDRSRFQVEAAAAAHLQHANIVQIFEFGEADGILYCAFEYVDGGTLAQRMRRQPLSPSETARLLATIADAVHYAHKRSVLHRDLKPDNILMTENGTPKIADFGLAKRLDDADSKTITGVPMGTPAYMSPEQAEGSTRLTPATDIYSLGAIMYHCLVGQPVFQGSVLTVLENVRSTEPVRPNALKPGIDRDLEAICLRCLQKEPGRRFATAAELSDDLRRFSAGLPVQSRVPSLWDRWRKSAKRNPLATTFGSLFVVSLLVALPIVVGLNIVLRRQQSELQQKQSALEKTLDQSHRSAFALQLRRAADLAPRDPTKAIVYLEDESICRPELRSVFWHVLKRYCDQKRTVYSEARDVTAMAVSPDASIVALGTSQGKLVIQPLDAPVDAKQIDAHTEAVTCVRFHPDGQWMATSGQDDVALIWETDSWQKVRTLDASESPVAVGDTNAIEFLGNDQCLTAHSDGVIRRWPAAGPATTVDSGNENGSLIGMSINADENLVASCAREPTGEIRVRTIPGWQDVGATMSEDANALAFHPWQPAVLVSTGARRMVREWSVSDNRISVAREFEGAFSEKGSCIAFSADGSLLAAGSYDQSVRVWDFESGRMLFVAQCGAEVLSLAFEESDRLWVGRRDQATEVWDLNRSMEPPYLVADADPSDRVIGRLVFDSATEQLVSCDLAGQIARWDPLTGRRLQVWNSPGSASINAMAVDREGWLAWASGESVFTCRSTEDLSDAMPLTDEELSTESIAVTPEGIVVATTDYRLMMLRPGQRSPVWQTELAVLELHYCKTAKRLFGLVDRYGIDDKSEVWIGDPKTGKGRSIEFPFSVVAMAVSDDAAQIAVANESGQLILADLDGNVISRSTSEQNTYITSLAFVDRSHTLVSSEEPGRLRFWDPRTRPTMTQRGSILLSGKAPTAIAVDDAGSRLFVGSEDGSIRVLEY
ncbi:WD40 repeat domain-containing serine/threonine protein kinase [Stieleria mannarensis]|uniref:WD40 repeat domain-containing serine/threonine protein kinase n=1 Tax=Stieleria mannarensis TaxID=2755585 RepID=UPI0016007A19|nr:protein kinase [Rhodopirellula sp. JC639]